MNDNRRLVIRIGQGSLSFSTTEDGEVVYEPYVLNSSISMVANWREALRTSPLLGKPAGRTLVMIDSPVLMVPMNEFREETRELLYEHAFAPAGRKLTVMYAVQPDLNCVAVFALQKDLRAAVKEAFPEARFIPAMATVWHHLHQRSYTGRHEKLYAYYHEHRLEVFSFQQNRFRFCNTFAANNPNDILYYVLAAWQQLGLTAEHDELHLAGELPEREALVERAQEFIKRVFYLHPAGEFNRAPVTQIAGMPYDLMVLFVRGENRGEEGN